MTAGTEGAARWRHPTVPLIGIVFGLAALGFYVLYSQLPVLFDWDGYYHLAVARAYGQQGLLHSLDWARFSVMHDRFGDKELLFHILLVPFATLADPSTGGVVALALLSAVVASVLAHAALRTIGAWGFAIPLLVFGTATDFSMRMIRVRPELLSLVLILAAIEAASAGRSKLLGVLAGVYALSYTAFEAFLGLCGLWVLWVGAVERRLEWRLVLYPALGIALGLVVHPDFPANVRIWLIQNVDFWRSSSPDVGREILSRTTRDTLLLNLGWWVVLLTLWRSGSPPAAAPEDTRRRDFTVVATAVFAVLYVLMARFITYLVPLATLAVLRAAEARGTSPARFVRLPGGRRVPFGLAMAACLPFIPYGVHTGIQRLGGTPRAFVPSLRADLEAFGRAMPDGAEVAAPWDATEAFVFWAPQGRYLNVLDPVFMSARDPAAYRAYLDLFEGRDPDIPLTARERFDSDFFADAGQYPAAKARLLADPRVERLHDGFSYLYRFVDGRNEAFLLDWKVLPADAPLPPPLDLVLDVATPAYPRTGTVRGRAIEGYVDGQRLSGSPNCVTFAHGESIARPTTLSLEVAPYGTAEIYVDDRPFVAIPYAKRAVLGAGVILPITWDVGWHRLAIRTCRADTQLGFYAVVRRMESVPR